MNNITFDNIFISGFLSIGEASVDLHEKGFVLVTGKNKETSTVQSNGSGKSTIFDSIFWTLSGETIRGASDVVNEKMTKEGCTCVLKFHDESHEYIIRRSKSHKEFGNSCHFYIDDELVSDQIKKSQEMISSTIPSVSSPEILGSIILLGQGLPYKFSSFSPMRRKDILETMSGSSSQIDLVKYKLDVEEQECNSRIRDYNADSSKCSGLISGHEGTISVLKSRLSQIKSSDEIDVRTEELLGIISVNENTISNLTTSIEETSNEIDQFQLMRESLESTIYQYKAKISVLESKVSSIKSGVCPTCGRPYEVSEDSLKDKEEAENELSQLRSTLSVMEIKLDAVKHNLLSYTSKKSNLENQKTACSYKISEAQREITSLTEVQDEADTINSQIKACEQKISFLKVKINDDEKLSLEEGKYLECVGYLKRQLSRDFKGYMLQGVIDFMSSRAEYYSDYLFTNGKKIEISLSGNKILISVGGRLYENLSGGERQRVDLAVQFSLRDMLVTTSGFSCNLLVLDEAFDNLDAQGSESLVRLVVNEFSDIDSVFVVTHHSEIDVPYDEMITVVKESDGISYLR